MGLYDFTDNQCTTSSGRARIVIRGSAARSRTTRWFGSSARTIVRSPLVRRQTGYDLDLDGFDTDHISVGDTILYRNPFPGLRFNDEDIAISSMLRPWRLASRRGRAAVSAGGGLPDHQVSLAIDQSAATNAPVATSVEAWAAKRGELD